MNGTEVISGMCIVQVHGGCEHPEAEGHTADRVVRSLGKTARCYGPALSHNLFVKKLAFFHLILIIVKGNIYLQEHQCPHSLSHPWILIQDSNWTAIYFCQTNQCKTESTDILIIFLNIECFLCQSLPDSLWHYHCAQPIWSRTYGVSVDNDATGFPVIALLTSVKQMNGVPKYHLQTVLRITKCDLNLGK